MSDDEDLRHLSRLAGILPAYWDITGQRHETSPEGARAILAVQSIPAANAEEVRASIRILEEEPWREILPPVVLAEEGRSAALRLHIPDGVAERPAVWTVHQEDGTSRRLDLDVTTARPAGARDVDGRPIDRRELVLPPLPCGYHGLEMNGPAGDVSTSLIVAPRRCHVPMTEGRRLWGVSAQLYALRSERGIGDFSDLGDLLEWAEAQGAGAVGINPLHALFPENPAHASPYSPNSRQFLNPLYLDVTRITEFASSEKARALHGAAERSGRIASASAASNLDYAVIRAIKEPVFEALYESFCARDAQAYRRFAERGGIALERFAIHASLCEAFGTADWTTWPRGFRDPASPQVAEFVREHKERIAFHTYLQWQCDLQLGEAVRRGERLAIGIYGDLAVSTSPDGSDVWAAQDVFLAGARVGAPPDPFNEAGQEWGVVPMNPARMRATGYANFIQLLRANMRHFGALRIDHAMELERLFWVPRGAPTSQGVYVRYPVDDLLAIIALESRRNECVVIGEDLGTVPEGFRERLGEHNVLSYRVLYFEQEHGCFKQPDAYPELAAAVVSTHDLPTLKGFWEETDLEDRLRAGVLASVEALEDARRARRRDKGALLEALAQADLLPSDFDRAAAMDLALTPALAGAIHRFLARSPARLFMVQIDDLAGEAVQANMPGTIDSHPNWRRRLHVPLAGIAGRPDAAEILKVLREERPPPALEETRAR
jgi:4-alpha-glucanotransferase